MFMGAGGNLNCCVFLERLHNKRQRITNSDELKVETEIKNAETLLKFHGESETTAIFSNKNKFPRIYLKKW